MDQRELFEGVCRVLERAGFELAAPGAAGLYVRHRREGVVVGWRLDDVAASSIPAQPDVHDRRGQRGLRGAVTAALSAVLGQAGYAVTGHDSDLLVTGSPGPGSR